MAALSAAPQAGASRLRRNSGLEERNAAGPEPMGGARSMATAVSTYAAQVGKIDAIDQAVVPVGRWNWKTAHWR